MKAALLLALAGGVHAAVDGTVVNGSAGKPQAGVTVTLVSMSGSGMQPRTSVQTDAQGGFRFGQTPAGPSLIQAMHQGVTYSLAWQPGSPASGLRLEVYDTSPRPGSARPVQNIVLLEPSADQLSIRETVIWQNSGKTTYSNPATGTLRVHVPPEGANSLRVSVIAPGGLPLQQAASAAGPPDVYKVDFPIKPGETSFEVSYQVPFSSPGVFSGRSLQKDAPLRLVVPHGVVLTGDGLESLGQEPQSQASIYGVKGPEYKVEIQGMAVAPAAGGEEESSSGLNQILPRVYDNAYTIVGLSLAILALGFVLLYRARGAPAAQSPPSPRSKKQR
ncbi:MAG TPA: carboxypeptidase-like regulatory domain-containing protein [Bryobacteraceae bacterium]|nr:carboxypeptidase-like regulatory domain-containing protein [Bryobacteraceae bacterium]